MCMFCLRASPLSVRRSLIVYCQYNPRPIDHVGCRRSSWFSVLCCRVWERHSYIGCNSIMLASVSYIYIYINIHRTFCLGRAVFCLFMRRQNRRNMSFCFHYSMWLCRYSSFTIIST